MWLVEEREYCEDYLGYSTLDYTDVVYLASSKELAVKFIHDHKDDIENVWSSVAGEIDERHEVAIYEMPVDSLVETLGKYDCRTIEEWCKEYVTMV